MTPPPAFRIQGSAACAADERPDQVDVDRPAPDVDGVLRDRGLMADAGVVDEQVDAAQALRDRGERGGDGGGVGHVTASAPAAPPPSSAAASAEPVMSTTATVAPAPVSASAMRAADPARGAGHDGAPALEHPRSCRTASGPSRSRAIIQRWISAVPWPIRHSRTWRK